MSSLPDDLHALTADQPVVPDWPGLVRATVRARRQRRSVVAGVAALALVVGSGVGMVYAGSDDRDPTTLTVASPTPSPTAHPNADPGNPHRQRLSITATPDVRVLVAGEPIEFVVTVTGLAESDPVVEEPRFDGRTPGDVEGFYNCPQSEEPPPPRTERRSSKTFTHVFAPGRHTVEFRGSAGCSYYGADEVTLSYEVEAIATERSPSSTPTASSAPEPTSATTPAPSPSYPPPVNVVTVKISVSPTRPRVGDEVTITVVARGSRDTPYFTSVRYGYGQEGPNYPVVTCAGPLQPKPAKAGERREVFTYTYEAAGTDEITATAESQCSYYEGRGSAALNVVVDPVESPSPSASPTP